MNGGLSRSPLFVCRPRRSAQRFTHRGALLTPLDLIVIVAYFLVTVGIGLWSSRHQTTTTDYFLGARNLPAWAILLSIVATETSALTVISVPGIGARGDLRFLQLAFGYLVGRTVVAFWLLPGYFDGTQETAYARLERRFGGSTRRMVSAVFLVTRFLGDSVRIYAGAIPLALVTGWSVPWSIVAVGGITMLYTWQGGLRAVVWTDVVQLAIYIAGGAAALMIAWELAGGVGTSFAASAAAGKLRVIDPSIDFTSTYTLLGGLLGGGMLSAASHGTDHLIVQRLLSSRSLGAARTALIGSGVVVILQFALFLLVGTAIWAAGYAPPDLPADQVFTRFVVDHLPAGLAGLVVAGILAAAMSTQSSAINALASAVTHDFYAPRAARRDAEHLLRVGRRFSALWAVLLVVGALYFAVSARGTQTPVVVTALSIASITYGGLLGTYVLAGRWSHATGTDVIRAVSFTLVVMLVITSASWLSDLPGLDWLAPFGRLAWPWYVPLGTLLTVATGLLLSWFRQPSEAA